MLTENSEPDKIVIEQLLYVQVDTRDTMMVFYPTNVFLHVFLPFTGSLRFNNGRCCDMGQNDTIGKIELNPSFVLSSDETNCKNDIQLFHQLFDELCVNRDYH